MPKDVDQDDTEELVEAEQLDTSSQHEKPKSVDNEMKENDLNKAKERESSEPKLIEIDETDAPAFPPEKPRPSTSSTKNSGRDDQRTPRKPNKKIEVVDDDGPATDDDETTGEIAIQNLGHRRRVNAANGKVANGNLHMTQPVGRVRALAITSLVLGAAMLCTATASVMLVAVSPSHQSVQIESKWINIATIFSGVCGLLACRQRTLVSLCSCLLFALMSLASNSLTGVMHAINIYFRWQDANRQVMSGNAKQQDTASLFVNVNVVLSLLGFVSAIVSLLLFRTVLHVAGKNFGYSIHVDKHRLRLALMGLAQVIGGMMTTTWWTGIEIVSQGRNADLSGVPTSELLTHGLVFVCTGYIQMMATSKGNQPMLVCAATMNAISLLFTSYFFTRPFSIMYFSLQQPSSEMHLDVRVWISAMLILLYTMQLVINVYSTVKFVHLAAGDRVSRIDNMLHKWRNYFSLVCYVQFTLGMLYTFFEVIAFGAFFLYKLDFNSLPLFIIVSALFARGSLRMGSVMMITVTCAFTMCCAALSLRDIYLFTYHMFSHDTPDSSGSGARMTGARLLVHFGLALTALFELITACALVYIAVRVLQCSVACVCEKIHVRNTLSAIKWLIIVQAVTISIVLIGGLVLYLSPKFFLEKYGDLCLTTGALVSISLLLVIVASRSQSVALLPALAGQVTALAFTWQLLDKFAYFLHRYQLDVLVHYWHAVDYANSRRQIETAAGELAVTVGNVDNADDNVVLSVAVGGVVLAIVVFVALLASVLVGSALTYATAAVLQACRLQKFDLEPERTSELLDIGNSDQSQTSNNTENSRVTLQLRESE